MSRTLVELAMSVNDDEVSRLLKFMTREQFETMAEECLVVICRAADSILEIQSRHEAEVRKTSDNVIPFPGRTLDD